MRRLVLAVLAGMVVPASAVAQDLVGEVRDIAFRSLDIEMRTLDLVLDDADLSTEVQDLVVNETETEIRIELSADVLFDFDKSDIKEEAAAALKQVATMIRDHAGRPVRIEGHTDSKGADAYNQRLSEDRALSVKDWLVDEAGLDGAAFETKGYGETKPVAENEKSDGTDNPEGRQKNRRVDIVIGK